LRSIHASTATLVYTTIPVWGAILSFFAHHEAPAESAVIGGLVIMGTSIYFQLTSFKEESIYFTDRGKKSETASSPAPENEELLKGSQSDSVARAVKEEFSGDKHSRGYFPGALLTSQLKFPYYAAQAKKLLAELKIKLGAVKSLLLTTASSGIVTSTSSTPPPGPAAGTMPVSNGANSLPSGTSTIGSVTTHVAKVDVSTTQHIAPHGSNAVGPVSASPDLVSEALKSTHTSDVIAVAVNVGSHMVTAATMGFESALIVVGSDIMLGFEEAEDAATTAERLLQTGVDTATQRVVALVSGGAVWLESASSNFVQSTADAVHLGGNFVLPIPPDVAAGVTETFLHHLVPLLGLIQ
jgi:hypothetical protein